jgi:hypothetical protein
MSAPPLELRWGQSRCHDVKQQRACASVQWEGLLWNSVLDDKWPDYETHVNVAKRDVVFD